MYAILPTEKSKHSSSPAAPEANNLLQVPSVARPSNPVRHISGPPSALVNLSPNPVDSFFKDASVPVTSTPNMLTQSLSLRLSTAGLLLGLRLPSCLRHLFIL